MTISCSLCKEQFTSVVVPEEKALEELLAAMTNHAAKKHGPILVQLRSNHGEMAMRLMWVMFMQALVISEETFVANAYAASLDALKLILQTSLTPVGHSVSVDVKS